MGSKKIWKNYKYSNAFHRQISRNVWKILNCGTQSVSVYPSIGNVVPLNTATFQGVTNNAVSENKYAFVQKVNYMC